MKATVNFGQIRENIGSMSVTEIDAVVEVLKNTVFSDDFDCHRANVLLRDLEEQKDKLLYLGTPVFETAAVEPVDEMAAIMAFNSDNRFRFTE